MEINNTSTSNSNSNKWEVCQVKVVCHHKECHRLHHNQVCQACQVPHKQCQECQVSQELNNKSILLK